ncbi:hypothetical protein GCM10008986_10610 [Salinibacillus aidingensis]|uniref:N-acetylglucosaminyl deacetylase, LmbE family n=1 Tax=Salinibacillus aidingensis TaxID=237684 RepID=A0ABN1AZ92_9BACI
MSIKEFIINISKPILTPITRFVLKRHYQASRPLTEVGKARKVLVLAPHMDDETIGAGGTLHKHTQTGAEVYCVFVTDGSNSVSDLDKTELTAARKNEINQVQGIIGFKDVYYMDLPDGKVKSNNESQEKLKSIIEKIQPDLIYCTPFVDAHPDHVATGEILSDTLRQMNYSCMVRLYEINCPIPPDEINCIIDISDTLKYKKQAIDVFSSQAIAFDGFIELNYIKTELAATASITAVEGFLELDSSSYYRQFSRLKEEGYDYTKLFKQANRTATLLWAVYQNYKLKKQIYQKRLN